MQNLQNLISQLESKISQCETTNLVVSGGSVGWHIEHSLKTIDQIVTACENSNPSNYQWHFNFKRFLIMSIAKKIPRGKAKAPKVVVPQTTIDQATLLIHLNESRKSILELKTISKDHYFEHPFFGKIKRDDTIRFLEIHTNHHLEIIEDIIKS